MAGLQFQGRRAGLTRFVRGAAALLLGLSLLAPVAQARESQPDGLPTVELSALPAQARDTHALVLSGGPFPFAKDGTVFGNRERQLPKRARGFYREYTVQTPGSRDRGARRLVCGGKPPTQPTACYYTEDHYASFRRVVH